MPFFFFNVCRLNDALFDVLILLLVRFTAGFQALVALYILMMFNQIPTTLKSEKKLKTRNKIFFFFLTFSSPDLKAFLCSFLTLFFCSVFFPLLCSSLFYLAPRPIIFRT